MRIFVYEYTCALPDAASAGSLAAEGQTMLSAVLHDFRRIPGIETLTLTSGTEAANFRALAQQADWSLLIAPEQDGILAERCRWVEEVGGRLLGPSSEAVRLTGDKLLTFQRLSAAGVPTPTCRRLDEPTTWPAVLKPRDGAGSQATFLIRDEQESHQAVAQAAAEGWRGELMLQTYVPGMAASVAFLIGPGRCVPLLPAEQRLSEDGRFRYLGGRLPLVGELGERAIDLGRRAVAAVSGLRGYAGVDLVLGDTDQVIEINPRLTTSYVGLRALAETNLAEAMLQVVSGDDVKLRWRSGEVRFEAEWA